MSPLRHDDQGAGVVPSWQNVIEEKIAEARERGEFDNLPGTGQPLRIAENPFAGDWEMAFHLLENAEMAPPWMEMSREVREGTAELATLRERTARYLSEQLALAHERQSSREPGALPQTRRWWWPFHRGQAAPLREEPRSIDRSVLEAKRRRARRAYLAQAARLDEVIAAYNAWLPENLRRLHKPRLSPERAARDFDAACPPIPGADDGAA